MTTCQAKRRSASSPARRRPLGHDADLAGQQSGRVPVLGQEAPGQPFEVVARRDRIGHARQGQQAQVGLGSEDLLHARLDPWRDHDLSEDACDLPGGIGIERPVAGDDAAEGAERITGQRLGVGLGQRRPYRHAARVGVLDDRDGGFRQLGHQGQRGIRVVEIVERQLLALHLARGGEARGASAGGVEGAALMRVLAVAQELAPAAGHHEALGELLAGLAGEPAGDCGVVGGRAGEGLGRQPAAEAALGAAAGLELVRSSA